MNLRRCTRSCVCGVLDTSLRAKICSLSLEQAMPQCTSHFVGTMSKGEGRERNEDRILVHRDLPTLSPFHHQPPFHPFNPTLKSPSMPLTWCQPVETINSHPLDPHTENQVVRGIFHIINAHQDANTHVSFLIHRVSCHGISKYVFTTHCPPNQ